MKKIEDQCRSMSDEELITALTVHKDEYTEEFNVVAAGELETRGKSVAEFLDRVGVSVGGQTEETVTIEGALGRLKEMAQPFGVIGFSNCMGMGMLLQKASLCWMVHDLSGAATEPLIVKSDQKVEAILSRFFNLEGWEVAVEGGMRRDAWTALGGKESEADVMAVCAALEKEGIPSALEKQATAGGCGGGACVTDKPAMLVEREQLEQARSIHEALENAIESLYEQVSELEGEENAAEELELLGKLAELVPQDEMVHFNRGVLLFDMQRLGEAAESFTAAAFNRNDMEVRQDATDYLVEILEKLPQSQAILHNLASLAMESGNIEDAEGYFKRIVENDPEDAVAHLNLGHIYYANTDDSDLTLHHMNAFLLVSTDSPERMEAERIVSELA